MRLSIVIGALLVALAGCNTVEGMGKDIQSGGQTIEGAAKSAQ
ncbi:entericidin A/B family lipoprotein [Pseudoruegeria sp. SK021]|nr:entericidin A/B family lipoprotein [Pseudoruegeria sp. SK021]OSP55472.1 entericidin [Pseudoruegeria sp. SK021]